jgi:hypothetical protein
MNTNESNFQQIIDVYLETKRSYMDELIKECKHQSKLTDAIILAVNARLKNGNKHDHQQRISPKKLEYFSERLLSSSSEFEEVKSFDELHVLVAKHRFKGIGELTIYDTAERIGTFLNLKSEKVYLHRGTKEGAKHILGSKIRGKKAILKSELPIEFQNEKLSCSAIEDILCIFKKEFAADYKKENDNIEQSALGCKLTEKIIPKSKCY